MAAASSSALRAEPLRHAEALPAQFREYLKNMLTALQTGRVRGVSKSEADDQRPSVGRGYLLLRLALLMSITSVIVAEALTLYEKGRRDMNSRFFSESNWPEAAVVQEVLKVDDGFRCLYETLWFKHATVTLPQRNEVTRLRLLIDSYAVYTRIIREFMGAFTRRSPCWKVTGVTSQLHSQMSRLRFASTHCHQTGCMTL